MSLEELLEEKFMAFIAEKFSVSKDRVTMNSRFKEDLKADSLDLIETVMQIEEDYEISIPDDIAEKMQTVRDVYTYLKGLSLYKSKNSGENPAIK